jgi:hypothetical protein
MRGNERWTFAPGIPMWYTGTQATIDALDREIELKGESSELRGGTEGSGTPFRSMRLAKIPGAGNLRFRSR